MESALDLLDLAGAPAEIGAHLDLAICQLRNTIVGSNLAPTSAREGGRAEPHPPDSAH